MTCSTCGGATRTMVLLSSREEGFCDACGTGAEERASAVLKQLSDDIAARMKPYVGTANTEETRDALYRDLGDLSDVLTQPYSTAATKPFMMFCDSGDLRDIMYTFHLFQAENDAAGYPHIKRFFVGHEVFTALRKECVSQAGYVTGSFSSAGLVFRGIPVTQGSGVDGRMIKAGY